MNNPFTQERSLEELLPDWPNLQWACSYSGTDKLLPDPKTAIIREVVSLEGRLRVAVEDQGRTLSAVVQLAENQICDRVCKALTKAIGKTIEACGDGHADAINEEERLVNSGDS